MKEKEAQRGDGLIEPNQDQNVAPKRGVKKIPAKKDGLMEREEIKVITEDGRELLK